ncbi:MAG: TlyA family RNA methyltransferase [Ruminococcaceae bacterium]|nr:TlyA family RNA methyltransferase [Oscillospiraceae bacterium]
MKKRLDVVLFEKELVSSREKARAVIMSGNVFVDGLLETKPGLLVSESAVIDVKSSEKFCSRGGYKLDKAIKSFGIDINGAVAADIGASTGGFTDCMLQNGALKVYSIDVGYGQIAWELRNDPRVKVIERTNARYLTSEHIPEKIDFFAIDVSFISVKLIIPGILKFCNEKFAGVILIKPQFEIGKGQVGKRGVVSDFQKHIQVLNDVFLFLTDLPLSITGLTYSPIKGPNGNIEFLVMIENTEKNIQIKLEDVVNEAHLVLK